MSTSTILGPQFAVSLIDGVLKAIDEGTRWAYSLLWKSLISFLVVHWLPVLIVLGIVLVIAIVKAVLGRWGMLGSVLYNYLYFGILFVVGIIWGSDVFASNWFGIITSLVLYPLCFWVVGLILKKIGVIH